MLSQESEGELSGAAAGVASFAVEKLRSLPHENSPWTQGFEFTADGRLLETTGDFPRGSGSSIRVIDTQTGKVLRTVTDGTSAPDGTSLFLEGICELNGRFFASTYKDHKVLEFNQDLTLLRTLEYPHTGWGLTHSADRQTFLGTNGTQFVLTLEPETFKTLASAPVTCMGKEVSGLNELEMVDDFLGSGPALLGNLINTRLVLVLDPNTFACRGTLHLRDLEPTSQSEYLGYHVANGIAYNPRTSTFWVTGKNWDSMYEVRIREDTSAKPEAAVMLANHLGTV